MSTDLNCLKAEALAALEDAWHSYQQRYPKSTGYFGLHTREESRARRDSWIRTYSYKIYWHDKDPGHKAEPGLIAAISSPADFLVIVMAVYNRLYELRVCSNLFEMPRSA